MPPLNQGQHANRLPRGIDYRGSDAETKAALAIVDVFMQRMRAREESGVVYTVQNGTNAGAGGAITLMAGSNISIVESPVGTFTFNVTGTNQTFITSLALNTATATITIDTQVATVLALGATARTIWAGTNCGGV